MAASEAAVTAVMEALDCKREVDRNGHAYCEAHWYGWLSDADACPRAERAANAAVDADRASIQAETIDGLADKWQRGDWIMVLPASLGPKVVGLGQRVTDWLRARINEIEAQP